MGFLRQRQAIPPQAAAVLPQYTGLQLQTATNVLPVPIIWGMTKTAVNIIYYSNFTSHPQYSMTPVSSGGKGGGGGVSYVPQLSGYTYSADLILALCEGPIAGIGQVWQGQSTFNYSGGSSGSSANGSFGWNTFGLSNNSLGLVLYNGANPQSVWGYMSSAHPSEALAYSGIAYLGGASFDLGSSANIGTLSFEVKGLLFGTGINGTDADPALVISDFLVNSQYGVGFPGSHIDATTLFGSGGDSSVQTYCRAMGFAISPKLDQSETASSILQRWAQLLNVGVVWSGDRMRLIPYGDQVVSGNGYTWVPNTTPIYSLDDTVFVRAMNEDPLQVQRVDPYTLPTVQRVEALNRSGVVSGQGQPEYQATPVEARDQAMIEMFGLRVGSTITAHEICDMQVAQTVAQTILQRGLYVRNQFTFKLPAYCCLLDPMDVVTISDTPLGLAAVPVRLIDIAEDDDGVLTCIAEELVSGISTPAANPSAAPGSSSTFNPGVAAKPVNTPLIFEPPPGLTNNVNQIWLGASGGVNGVADPNWGGCIVWVSVDNGVTYQSLARINVPMVQGTLLTPFGSALGWDSTNVAAVDLTMSGGSLVSITQAAALAGQNLCLIGTELMAFQTATLSGTNKYQLTGLARGLFASSAVAHPAGDWFSRLDSSLVRYNIPASYIGVPLFFKFQSFNVLGGGLQDISTCTPYPYTPVGAGTVSPLFQGLQLFQNEDWGAIANSTVVNYENWGSVTGNAYGRTTDLGGIT